MLRKLSGGLLTALAVGLSATTARASTLTLNYSGIFGLDSSLNLLDLDNTPFTFTATFDSTTDTFPLSEGLGAFPAVVTFDIQGFGTFTTAPAADLVVVLFDPSFGSGFYSAGIAPSDFTELLLRNFSTASPPFDADAPTPTVLTGPGTTVVPSGLVIALADGSDVLLIGSILTSLGDTASITADAAAPVPEPGTLTLLSLGTLGLTAFARRRRFSTARGSSLCNDL